MDTEHQSLEDMLDGTSAPAAEAPPSTPEPTTGVTDSAAPPADAQLPSAQRDDAPLVPRKALEDERRKRQEFEKQLQELQARVQPAQPQQQAPQQQQQFEPPDPYVDPQGYAQWVAYVANENAMRMAARRAEEIITSRELNRSERAAIKTHGQEAVDAAFEAAVKAGVAGKFTQEEDPWQAIVDWHKSYQIASNPDQFRAQIEAEILAKHGITPQAAPQVQSRQKAPVPRSLASTASAAPRDERGRFAEHTPIEELIP